MTEYVVIGDGAAGTTTAQYIRKRDPDGRITILSDDPNAAYYRAALTNYLIGELREDQLFAVPPDFYARNRIQRVLARVASIDTVARRITLTSGGTPLAYDRVLGSRFGVAAIDAVSDGDFGKMVALRGTDVVRVPLDEALAAPKLLDPALFATAEVFFG